MTKPLDELLAKKMDRREFLKHVGIGTLTLFGFGLVLKLLGHEIQPQRQTVNSMSYGSYVYGGRRRG